MEKINVAELLRYCPQGMELDSPVWDNIEFDRIDGDNIVIFRKHGGSRVHLTQFGEMSGVDGKCVIFPKGKTTWEGFQIPFKDGDIVTIGSSDNGVQIFIFKEYIKKDYATCHMMLESDGTIDFSEGNYYITRFATEEEKQKLFQAIKDNGYRWNAETKTLEKLPKFKVWGRIKHKFDINTLKPFDKVLYRMHNKDTWLAGFYNVCIKNKIFVIGLQAIPYCIPYEGNEHLLGTTNDCDEYYKTW